MFNVSLGFAASLVEECFMFNLRQVLRHMTAEGHGQRLDATADAEDRKLTVIGQTRDEQFGEVALGIDSAKQRGGLLTSPVGVVVATATQDEGINARQRVQDGILIGNRGNDQGYTACAFPVMPLPSIEMSPPLPLIVIL